ncbi:MAG: MAG4270 family putative restriction endonuclease [Mycoplasma sp.]
MDKYFKLVIPFQKRSINMDKLDKIFCTGTAYFIIDKTLNKIVYEYLEIKEANYRLTDKDLIYSRPKMKRGILEPTEYYKDGKYGREFRENLLNSFTNHDPLKYNVKSNRRVLQAKEIFLVNEYFKKSRSTVRNMFAALSGSNVTGAETNDEASPLIVIDPRFFEANFLNPLKTIRKLNIEFDLNLLEEIVDEVSLAEMIDNNLVEGFKEVFDKKNTFIEYRDEDIEDEELEEYDVPESDFSTNNERLFNPKESQLMFIKMYLNDEFGKVEKTVLKNKIRSFFNANCKEYISKGYIPLFSTIKKYNLKIIENAHIKSVSSCIIQNTEQSLLDAINPYNCLRIPSNAHTLIDNDRHYIDIKGNLLDGLNKMKIQEYVDIQNLPKQTINFIKSPDAFK